MKMRRKRGREHDKKWRERDRDRERDREIKGGKTEVERMTENGESCGGEIDLKPNNCLSDNPNGH